MADEPTTGATAPDDASTPATPQTDPTPSQSDGKQFTADLNAEIDDLWAQAEGRAPKALLGEETDAAPEPATAEAEPATAETPAEPAKPDPSTETIDPQQLRVEAYEKAKADYEAAERAKTEAEARVRAEVQQRRDYEAYIGAQDAYDNVNAALRQALTGNYAPLNDLDVTLPNGQTVSQVKGTKGLTEEEAANLLTAWDTARRFEGVMGDRKVNRILGLWDADVMGVLTTDADIDASAVTQHRTPGQQIKAAIDQKAAAIEKRLTETHQAEVKKLTDEIKAKDERITSLVNERGNLTAQDRASRAATVERPGQPGNLRRDLPTPDELARMPADQVFKDGTIDRILQSIPGGLSAPPRRRTG